MLPACIGLSQLYKSNYQLCYSRLFRTLNFGKISGQPPGVNNHFQLRLLVSPEHGWSWDTTTIKTHLFTYKESLANHRLYLFITVLTHRHWDLLLNFVQVRLKCGLKDSQAQRFSGVQSTNLYRPTWHASLQLYSPFSSTQCTFIGTESTHNTITIVKRMEEQTQTLLKTSLLLS